MPTSKTLTKKKTNGRPINDGTVLARVMKERYIKVATISGVIGCSDRQTYNYQQRQVPIPILKLGALCDFMDMDPEELVDEHNFLLAD